MRAIRSQTISLSLPVVTPDSVGLRDNLPIEAVGDDCPEGDAEVERLINELDGKLLDRERVGRSACSRRDRIRRDPGPASGA